MSVDLFGNPVGGAAVAEAAPGVTEWAQLAGLLGVTDRCLRLWRAAPDWRWMLPLSETGVAEIRAWRATLGLSGGRNDRGKTAGNALNQQRRLKTELMAMEVAERRGELVSRAEVETEWRQSVIQLRDRLMGLGNLLGAELGLTGEQRAQVTRRCREFCERYSSGFDEWLASAAAAAPGSGT